MGFMFFLVCILMQCIDASDSFVFGTASASWQYEGKQHVGGRGPSIWEDYCGGVTPAGNPNCNGGLAPGAIAVDQYNLSRLQNDITLMQDLGTTAYRLSLSWSRIMPTGRFPVAQVGISHYKKVLRMLNEAGIEPWVTLFHFDLPAVLEREDNGWLNRTMADRFESYAQICFQEFGPLVNKWITINEAHTIATAGYLYGNAAPGRCSNRSFCAQGNGTTEPYIVAHNLLRAHAKAVDIFRKMQKNAPELIRKDSSITMVISGDWTEPWDKENQRDVEAAQRRQEFQIGWFGDPVFFGDYPESMKLGVGGGRLPEFTNEEKKMLRGSIDYFALNHYTSRYGQAPHSKECIKRNGSGANLTGGMGWDEDQCCVALTENSSGKQIGARPAGSDWLYSVPWGFRRLLSWVGKRYPGYHLVVTENGCVDPLPVLLPESSKRALNDTFRINYFREYLKALTEAKFIDNVDVRGYFIWSLLDNVEWGDGFRDHFGLHSVDYPSLIRKPKESAIWISNYILNWHNITSNQ